MNDVTELTLIIIKNQKQNGTEHGAAMSDAVFIEHELLQNQISHISLTNESCHTIKSFHAHMLCTYVWVISHAHITLTCHTLMSHSHDNHITLIFTVISRSHAHITLISHSHHITLIVTLTSHSYHTHITLITIIWVWYECDVSVKWLWIWAWYDCHAHITLISHSNHTHVTLTSHSCHTHMRETGGA